MTIFINRVEELNTLEKWKGKVALITGRRRIGKSRLILEFLKKKKAVYLLAADKGVEYNLRKFSSEISKQFNIPGLRFNDFEEMFEFFEKMDVEIIAVDEFGYLIKGGVIGEFQRIVDQILTKKLILSGSSISLLESRLIGYKSPMYGRIELIKRIHPLSFNHLFEWFPHIKPEDAIKLYAATNAIPRYLEFFQGKDITQEIKNHMFNPDLLLFRDTKLLLEEELPEPKRYFIILESLAFGKTTVSEISNFTGIPVNQLPYYLNVLKNLMFIKHEKPIFEKKRGVYKITDNYMSFWFRFISPFFEEIESRISNNAIVNFKENFNSFQGTLFEDICRELLVKCKFAQVGRWWYKDNEIDIIALDSSRALFCECKFKENINPKRILKILSNKENMVRLPGTRKISYIIFAKSFKEKIKKFNDKKVFCFDLKDVCSESAVRDAIKGK